METGQVSGGAEDSAAGDKRTETFCNTDGDSSNDAPLMPMVVSKKNSS